MEIVMRHEARQVPSWLIFDVGQKTMIADFIATYGQDLARLILGSLIGSAITLWWSRRTKDDAEAEKVAMRYVESARKARSDCEHPMYRFWLLQQSGALNVKGERARELVIEKISNHGLTPPGEGVPLAPQLGVFTLMSLATEAKADLRKAGDVYLKVKALVEKHRPRELV